MCQGYSELKLPMTVSLLFSIPINTKMPTWTTLCIMVNSGLQGQIEVSHDMTKAMWNLSTIVWEKNSLHKSLNFEDLSLVDLRCRHSYPFARYSL